MTRKGTARKLGGPTGYPSMTDRVQGEKGLGGWGMDICPPSQDRKSTSTSFLYRSPGPILERGKLRPTNR